MKVIFKSSFAKDLRKIKEHRLRSRVKAVIEQVEQAESFQEITRVKPMKGFPGYFRIRVGDYRPGFSFHNNTVILIRFLHRKEIYRYFP